MVKQLMESNKQFDLARALIETTDTSVFLTGRAGTGKTTFLRSLRKETLKQMVVLAPTGIAAINAEGVTIHSFFQLSFAPYIPDYNLSAASYRIGKNKVKMIQSLDLIVIDEVSMVRADLLDAVDSVLRRYLDKNRPFGGLQLLLIGDLQQLPPISKDEEWEMLRHYYKTPYFFSSSALKKTHYVTVELQQVYRQSDAQFIKLLNNIRIGTDIERTLSELNKRYISDLSRIDNEKYIQLVTHNWQARKINEDGLARLHAPARTYQANVKGVFPSNAYPTDETLTLKRGAKIMFIKNNPERKYFNGLIGEVVETDVDFFTVRPLQNPEQAIRVYPEVWNNARYVLDERSHEISEKIDGSFTQYPVKLAWAITIHKSQGLTFDKAMIDVSYAFSHGQTYVALSRCRTLDGIILTSPIPRQAIINDEGVVSFLKYIQKETLDEAVVSTRQRAYAVRLITDLFTFELERVGFAQVVRIIEESFSDIYHETYLRYKDKLQQFDIQVMSVADIFQKQYSPLLQSQYDEAFLRERLQKGASYFASCLKDVHSLLQQTSLDCDNQAANKRLSIVLSELINRLDLHISLLEEVAGKGFVLMDFLQVKRDIIRRAGSHPAADGGIAGGKVKMQKERKTGIPDGVNDEELYTRLVQWRKQQAERLSVPAYTILQTKAIVNISNTVPTELKLLEGIPYLGNITIKKYGSDIIKLVNDYVREKQHPFS